MRFKRLRHFVPAPRLPSFVHEAYALLPLITDEVASAFTRLTDQRVTIVPVPPDGRAHRTPNASSGQLPCEASQCMVEEDWRQHVEAAHADSTPYWHRCDGGHWCGVVPLRINGTLAAVCRAVSDASTSETDFVRHVEILHLLCECAGRRAPGHLGNAAPNSNGIGQTGEKRHALVRRALTHIETHLQDHDLSVMKVASAIGTNSTYLAHLFSRQVGTRMSEYIARRRVEQAARLLQDPERSVKEVAFACGFTNSSRFGRVFRRYAGLSPSTFRRRAESV